MSKYKVASTSGDDDDPFRVTAPSSAPKEAGAVKNTGSDSSSDVEMPGIGEILAEKEVRESQRTRRERLQQLKLAALAQQQQKRASTSGGAPRGAEQDSDDDELDVVLDTMHSVAREEAAARAVAGRMRPSVGRTTQLRLSRVGSSPQRPVAPPLIPTTDSPEKRMAAAAQPAFVSSLARGNRATTGRGKRSAGMTKAELERMVLRSAEAQSEQLRREKEDEWVRRGGRVVRVMEDVGEEKVQELIGEALERIDGTHAQGDGVDDAGNSDDDGDDADYVPTERGSASPRLIQSQGQGDDEEQLPAEAGERPDDDKIAASAVVTTDVDSETESNEPSSVHHHPRRRRTARTRRAVIGSDDEDGPSPAMHAAEEDAHPPPLSLPDFPSPAFTSTASPWPSGNAEHDHENDHENDPDVGGSGNETDKENRAVMPCDVGPAPTHGARVLFDDILSARAGTRAAVQPLPLLQPSVLPADDDPFAFTPSPAKAREEALRRLASPTFRHVPGKRGFSQMFEEEGDDFVPVPALRIQGMGDSDGATPGDADPGLVGFKPVLGGLSQAFERTQVIRTLYLYNTQALTRKPLRHTCRTHQGQGLGWEASLHCAAAQTPNFHSRSRHKPQRYSPL
jgi:mediator of replication checkpoint protein 1